MTGSYRVQPRYWQGIAGKLFVLEVEPEVERRGTVFIVPPFAEEMNRVRRTVFLQATRLSSAGFRVILVDQFGTGDSEGEFSDATWDIWLEDFINLIAESTGASKEPLSIIAIRLGALLSLEILADRRIEAAQLIFWQPVTDGERFLTQFLRLRTMSGMLSKSDTRENLAKLREQLALGQVLEVAGYELMPSLAKRISSLSMIDLISKNEPPITWIDAVSVPNGQLSTHSEQVAARIESRGGAVKLKSMQSPQFWSTPEIVVAENFVMETTRLLSGV